MKKYFTNLIQFTIFFILFSIVVFCFSFLDNLNKKTTKNHNIKRLSNSVKFNNLDILFIGNSYLYSGVKPDLFNSEGIKTFNLGVSTSGVEFYDLIIDDYLKTVNNPPKIIFILVSPTTFSNVSDNFISYPIHRYLNSPKSNLEIAVKYNHLDKLLLMYKKSITKGFENIFFNKVNSNYENNQGYYFSDKIYTNSIRLKEEKYYKPFLNETLSDVRLNKLKILGDEIQKQGIEVVYFELPTNILDNYFSQAYIIEYNNFINDLSKKNRFIKINKTLFTKENYRNIDHLNDTGAEIATRELIYQIKLNKFIE